MSRSPSADDPRLPSPPEAAAEERSPAEVTRRDLLRLGAVAGAGAPLAAGLLGAAAAQAATPVTAPAEFEEATIAEMLEGMESGSVSAVELVNFYLARIETIDRRGAELNAILAVNPQARQLARARDRERRDGNVRGPLHGIPIVVKDNIDTRDQMMTTAGSLALVGDPAPQDSTVARKLKQAGAIILGKANLSEWANFRGFSSTSGWSGFGGQTRNPYILDRNPCGSSSGSGAAASANLAAATLGTETDGSIVCPSSINGVVGIKPTVGLTSRAGVVPISHTQDTIGVHGRTVADAAAVLGVLTGVDPRDPATNRSAGKFHTDYTQFLDPDGLNGARIGIFREGVTGYSQFTDAVFEEAIAAMADAGAVIVDPADVPTINELFSDLAELIVLVWEFKRDLNAYLATRTGVPVQTMADVIDFNLMHADQELQFFGQEWFELSQAEIFSDQEYVAAVERGPRLAGPEGIDAVIAEHNLDAIVAPTGSPAWPIDLVNGDHFTGASSTAAAMAGYPIVQINAGFAFGLPIGISFMGGAFSEPTLIKLASGFENVVQPRRPPTFLKTMELPTTQGLSGAAAAAARGRARLERLAERLTRQQVRQFQRIGLL